MCSLPPQQRGGELAGTRAPTILYKAKSAAISGQLERALQLAAIAQFPLPEGLGRLLFKDVTTCPQDDSPHTSYTYMVKIVPVLGSQRYLDPQEKMLECFKVLSPAGVEVEWVVVR